MSIEVRVNTSVSSLWTCIKVLTEHIVCRRTELQYSKYIFCCLLVCHSLTHSVYFHSQIFIPLGENMGMGTISYVLHIAN